MCQIIKMLPEMRQIAPKVTENVSNDAKKLTNMCPKVQKVAKKCLKWCKKSYQICVK
jgi:hypothetical protein